MDKALKQKLTQYIIVYILKRDIILKFTQNNYQFSVQ